MIFVTSDHHFGHANVLQYCHRPFQNIDHMDQIFIQNWNGWVKPDDVVYHLGDFTLSDAEQAQRYFSQLNGNIYMLVNKTHHDKRWLKPYLNKEKILNAKQYPVTLMQPIVRLDMDNHVFVLCHFPLFEWENKHHGAVHLHGHSHGRCVLDNGFNCFDVGVDSQGYTPAPIDSFYPFAQKAEEIASLSKGRSDNEKEIENG